MQNLRDVQFSSLPIAVLDFETTGLSANCERVVQASVVHVNGKGSPVMAFDTLINPMRRIDPRAQAVHGISDRDVEDAPTFDEIAGDLLQVLEGRVIAAYNASFDLRFLEAEYRRSGLSYETAFICVMEFRQLIFAESKCKLVDACREMNLKLDNAHSSSADALVTAHLLSRYFELLAKEQIHSFAHLSTFGARPFLSSFRYTAFRSFSAKFIPSHKVVSNESEILKLNSKCEWLNIEVEQKLKQLESLLSDGIGKPTRVQWEKLFMPLEFSESPPEAPVAFLPKKPDSALRPTPEQKPSLEDDKYQVDENMLDSFLPWRVAQKESEARNRYESDVERFKQRVQRWNQLVNDYRNNVERAKSEFAAAKKKYLDELKIYDSRKLCYRQAALEHNAKITAERQSYESADPLGVARVMTRVLMNSEVPEAFPNSVEVKFDSREKCLSVIRQLPALDSMPKLKGYKVIKKTLEIREHELSETAQKRIYDGIVYQMMLRTIHEVYSGDQASQCNHVTVRGVVDGYDPATGVPAQLVIAKCTVDKETFRSLRLKTVEPQACFKELGGKTNGRPSNIKPLESIR